MITLSIRKGRGNLTKIKLTEKQLNEVFDFLEKNGLLKQAEDSNIDSGKIRIVPVKMFTLTIREGRGKLTKIKLTEKQLDKVFDFLEKKGLLKQSEAPKFDSGKIRIAPVKVKDKIHWRVTTDGKYLGQFVNKSRAFELVKSLGINI